MINNRQNGRRRGRGGNNNNQRGGNPGRPDSGNRIDSRARGNANQLYEKYKNLARDAQMSGDRVNTEYYLQFADHYFRVLSESRMRFEEQNPNAPQQRRIQPVDSFDDFDDAEDYADEGEPIRAGEQSAQESRADVDQSRGQRGTQRDGRDQGRDAAPRQAQPRYDGRRDDRYESGRYENGRAEGGRYEGRRNGHGDDGENGGERGHEQDRADARFAATASPVANDLGEDAPDGAGPVAAEPRRRGRPRRAATSEAGANGTAALDVDRLPPSLAVVNDTSNESEDGEGAARPRRRRSRAAGEASTLG